VISNVRELFKSQGRDVEIIVKEARPIPIAPLT
jgi:hypothetical protein